MKIADKPKPYGHLMTFPLPSCLMSACTPNCNVVYHAYNKGHISNDGTGRKNTHLWAYVTNDRCCPSDFLLILCSVVIVIVIQYIKFVVSEIS